MGGFDAECSLLTGEAVSKYNEDLECAGFCPVAMVAGDGTLIPGVEATGIVAYRWGAGTTGYRHFGGGVAWLSR